MLPKPEELVSHLHPLEIQTLRAFQNAPKLYASEMLALTALSEERVRMAVEWLQKKELLIAVGEHKDMLVSLTETGQELRDKKLIELRIIAVLLEQGRLTMSALAERIQEDVKETNIAVANLKKADIVAIQPGGIVSKIENADVTELTSKQQVIERIGAAGVCRKTDIDDRTWRIIEDGSRKRGKSKGVFRITEKVDKQLTLTESGQAVLTMILERGLSGEEISQLTPQMLQDASWQTKSFRAYNLEGTFPRIVVGKKNPYRTFLDFVKRKLLSLGFEEMRGPLVESEFWNMDALYMPQFHPARAIHDAYYVTSPTHCKEIKEPNYSNVVDVHTFGGKTRSKGWRYQFDKERTKRLVLRSQGTALSIRQLANRPNIPGKYFAMARCFRYDAVDSTHAPDFFQVEGIVLGEEINFRHLLGLLKLFAMEIAKTKEMKFAPAYFPFTEPSVEVHMKHPDLGWIELGGAGIFRPEVTAPQGIDVPVIAWGLGLDRMAMVALDIQDIRDLFATDLDVIRTKRVKTII
jgi:phenylalanyl-tRNA synthetase alpha chain